MFIRGNLIGIPQLSLNVKWCSTKTEKFYFKVGISIRRFSIFLKEIPQSKCFSSNKRWLFFTFYILCVQIVFLEEKHSLVNSKERERKQIKSQCLLGRLIPLKCEMHQFVWRFGLLFFISHGFNYISDIHIHRVYVLSGKRRSVWIWNYMQQTGCRRSLWSCP